MTYTRLGAIQSGKWRTESFGNDLRTPATVLEIEDGAGVRTGVTDAIASPTRRGAAPADLLI